MSIIKKNDKYHFCWLGSINPVNVKFDYNPFQCLELNKTQIEEKISIIEKFSASGKKIEILPLYKFLTFSKNEEGLVLKLCRTDFGEYLLTDISHPEWCLIYGDEYMSHPLSISAVTLTTDNYLIIGYRSNSVIGESGKIQTLPGGFLHPPDSIMETTMKELSEELAVNREDISEVLMQGIALVHPSGKPEILLKITLNISSSEILSRHGIDKWEFKKIITIPNTRKIIEDFINSEQNLTPASHASLMCLYSQTYDYL